MQTFSYYQTRADMAAELAARPENAPLRDKYLALGKDWSALARRAALGEPAGLDGEAISWAPVATTARVVR